MSFNKNYYNKNKQDNNRIGFIPGVIDVRKLESIDIDEEVDIILAEYLYQQMSKYETEALIAKIIKEKDIIMILILK